MVHT